MNGRARKLMLRDFARGRKYEMLKGYVAAVCPRSDCVVVFRICRNLVQLMAKSDGQSCFPTGIRTPVAVHSLHTAHRLKITVR